MNDHLSAHARRARARASAVILTAVLSGSVLATLPVLGAAAGATSAPGTWAATLTPPTACAGSTVTFTFTVTNNSSSRAIGGVFLEAPVGFDIPSTGQPEGVSVSTYGDTGRDVAAFGSLSVSDTKSLSFNATVGSTSGSWVAEAESGDDPFDNDPDAGGDDFHLTVSQPSTTVAAGCHLVFTAQPTDAGKNKTITSVALDDTGAPVAVQVQDSANALVPVSVPVSLALNTLSGGPGTLSGDSGATSGGVWLPSPAVDKEGKYTLTASAPSNPEIAPGSITNPQGISSAFKIWGAAQSCAVNCNLTVGDSTNQFTVSATQQAGAGLGTTLNVVTLDCSPLKFGGFSPIPGTQTFGWTYTGNGYKTETILIGKSLLTTKLLLAKALVYQVCYSAPVQFITYFGLKAQPDPVVTAAMGGQQFYTGLLRPCLSSNPNSALAQNRAPCVLDRQWTSAGEVVKILSNPGDPHAR